MTEQPDTPDSGERPDTEPAEQPATGVSSADEARERLSAVESAPLEEHVEVYEDVHRRLQEGLADLDER
jgi:hypothetical protein